MKLWKTLLVLLGFGAIWGFNMVVPGFAIVRSRCCEDIDSPLEEVSQDWQIADVVSGRVDWEPDVVLEHRAKLATRANPEQIETTANSLAALGRFEEAKKLLQNLPATNTQLKTELAAKYQYFKYAATGFKDKQALSGALKTAKSLSPDYLKTTPRAAVLATIIRTHEAFAFETLSNEQRVELWFKRVKELGIPAVRDSTIALIKEQGPKADPNLFFMLSVIDSTRSQNPNEMRCSLASQQLAEKGIERHQIAFVDDMKSTGLFNFRHQGASAVDLLIKSANEYRSHRTKYMVDQAKLGHFPEESGYWSEYKPVERPNLNGYHNWIPIQLRQLEVRIVEPFAFLAMVAFACFLLVCLERIYGKPRPGRQQSFRISMQ